MSLNLPADNHCPIIPHVARRIHVDVVRVGEIALSPEQSHHARDVLRLADETGVEVFDDAGRVARGSLRHVAPRGAFVRVEKVDDPLHPARLAWTIAAAVPKGDRADWMVEKLSELGAAAFIPLSAARSVVLPEGKNKRERWTRLAIESAKQSRRGGVMQIGELTPLDRVIASLAPAARGWFLATEIEGRAVRQAVDGLGEAPSLTICIGPEGGWDQGEISAFTRAGFTAVRLGGTILRIETAAVAAGAIVSALLA